nr:MAG TPA: hypothetical protein [Bacteriophage sp.]
MVSGETGGILINCGPDIVCLPRHGHDFVIAGTTNQTTYTLELHRALIFAPAHDGHVNPSPREVLCDEFGEGEILCDKRKDVAQRHPCRNRLDVSSRTRTMMGGFGRAGDNAIQRSATIPGGYSNRTKMVSHRLQDSPRQILHIIPNTLVIGDVLNTLTHRSVRMQELFVSEVRGPRNRSMFHGGKPPKKSGRHVPRSITTRGPCSPALMYYYNRGPSVSISIRMLEALLELFHILDGHRVLLPGRNDGLHRREPVHGYELQNLQHQFDVNGVTHG